jgi:hypothetical protein
VSPMNSFGQAGDKRLGAQAGGTFSVSVLWATRLTCPKSGQGLLWGRVQGTSHCLDLHTLTLHTVHKMLLDVD